MKLAEGAEPESRIAASSTSSTISSVTCQHFQLQPPRQYLIHVWSFHESVLKMKLDTKAIRYLTGEDWRVLQAVCKLHLKHHTKH